VEDVKDARELVEERMRDTGFEQDILDKVMDLLERFDDDREKLFEEMLSKLEQPGYDGLRDRWATNCEQAEALMDRLEEDMRSVMEDSQANAMSADERWTAVGPHDFLTGERKIWQNVAKLDVPDAATLMSKVLEADLAIIKKCDEDLKNARANDAIVQQILVKNFATATDKTKALLAKFVQLPTGIARLVVLLVKDPSAKAAMLEVIKAYEQISADIYEAAKQKRAARQLIVQNVKLISDARDQLDEDWINQLFARGAEAAANWRGIGATGDYRAADWDWFKENVLERGLDTRAEDAKEQSKHLYDELFPTFVTESTKAFAQLTDDPATLANFTRDLKETSDELKEMLENEEEFVDSDMADGDYKQTAKAALDLAMNTLKVSWDLFFQKTKEADDQVKS